MVAVFTAEEILGATSSHLKSGMIDDRAGKLVWNLDKLEPGDWYVAIPSEWHDPHDSLNLVFDMGARGCIVNRRGRYVSVPAGKTLIAVPDTRLALLDLVRYWRYVVNPRVVGVTGSKGRRATMILLNQLLKDKSKAHVAFMGNLGWFGCMQEVLLMPRDAEVLIFEAGSVERGDIGRLGGALDPDLVVLTQSRHPLPSPERDEVHASIYCELVESLGVARSDCTAVVAYDDNVAVRRRLEEVLSGLRSTRRSLLENSIADQISDSYLQELSARMRVAVGLPVSRAEVWCAIESAIALGRSIPDIMAILELDKYEAPSSASANCAHIRG